jgi:hypothetical protein
MTPAGCDWSRLAGEIVEGSASLDAGSGARRKRVSEGDPENWAAVARAISDCVRELGWRQRELAARSHAPVMIAGTAFLSRFIGRRACR